MYKQVNTCVNTVAEGNDPVMAEVMNLLEAEPDYLGHAPVSVITTVMPSPDIPDRCEQLAILVSTGKAKEAIGVTLTHKQVKCLSNKDVEKHYKRYET